MKTDRRMFLSGGLALGAAACIPPVGGTIERLTAQLRIIEAAAGGSLGVEIFDVESGRSFGINRNSRFGHASSFKLSLAAMVLAMDSSGLIDAERTVTWGESDLLSVSPFTRARVSQGASLRELAEAAQKYSDNTAANVLLRELGGPAALTGFWRSIGDATSQLDRLEPALNHVPSGEVRDTTTPAAMARTVAALCYGQALTPAARRTLREWMVATETGLRRVRSGLPEAWRAGDKTGTSLWPGMASLYVDIGFVEPAGQGPIAFAAYHRAARTHSRIEPVAENALARVGGVIADYVRSEAAGTSAAYSAA